MLFLEILLLLILVSGSAFFSSAEMSLFSLPRAKVSAMRDSSSPVERKIYFLMNNYNRTLVTIILSNMFVNSLISMLNDTVLRDTGLSGVAVTVLSALSGILVLLLFGEITPMSLAYAHCDRWSKIVAPIVIWMRKILFPVVFVAEKFCSFIVGLFGKTVSSPLSPEEYSSYIDIALRKGAFSASENHLLHESLELCSRDLSEVMLPRTVSGFIRSDASAEQVASAVYASGRIALLVGDRDIDSADRILLAYEFLRMEESARKNWIHSDCVKQARFIPEPTPVILALRILRKQHLTAAIVTDEYGGIAGIVTLPRIYFSLTGAYVDELPGSIRQSLRRGVFLWEFDGRTPVDAVMEETSWKPSPDDGPFESSTLNGVFCELSGALPAEGARVRSGNAVIRVLECGRNTASRLEISILPDDSGKRSES